jgi:dTDP-4-dehydrorhamnose reductase
MGRNLLLITGSGGRLGHALCEVLEDEYADTLTDVVFATRDEIDLTDYFRVREEFVRIAPTVVINCAAYTDVDGCEVDRGRAHAVNVEGPRHVARAARLIEARTIHVSTDLVFDGAAERPYREDDEVNPLSYYAESKLEGEKAVAEENPDHTILRSSWFFGPWPRNRYPEAFLESLRGGETVSIIADRIGSPTYLKDLARALARLAMTPYRGILHFANSGEPTSRFHCLQAIARRLDIDTERLVAISNDDWTRDVATRPVYSALDPTRYAEVTGHHPRTWMESIEEYVQEREGHPSSPLS